MSESGLEKIEDTMASRGGKASAAKLSPEQRKERAKKAAAARWNANLPRATHGSDDHPMKVAGIEIPCYVLDNGMRVITHRGLQGSISMAVSGSAMKTASFVAALEQKGLDCKDLVARLSSPLEFMPTSGRTAFGYEATVLADLCDILLEARLQGGILTKMGERMAARCEILARGFARVGIIALVDEATGYQEARERDALAKILEAFIAKALRPYMRTFEPDYYKAVCELRGWEFKTSSRRPRALAHITNDLIYSRLAPGVLDELRRKNPVVKDGRRGSKHFQWLTEQKGHPELQKHLAKITGWMQMAKAVGQSWDDFYLFLNKMQPKYRGPTLFDDLPKDDLDDDPAISTAFTDKDRNERSSS